MKASEYWKLQLKPGDHCIAVGNSGDDNFDPASITYFEVVDPPEQDTEGSWTIRVHPFAFDDSFSTPGGVETNLADCHADLTPAEWEIAQAAKWPPTLALFMQALRMAWERVNITPAGMDALERMAS